jgi:predicted dehydrogenase
LVGDVSEVFAFADTLSHERIEVEDTAVAALRFNNGAMGVIEGTTSAYPGFLKRLEILGTKGSAILEEESIIAWQFEDEEPGDEEIRKAFLDSTKTGGGAADPLAIGHHGHTRNFASFVKSIRENSPIDVSGLEARRSVELIEAIYRSAKSGKKIKLPL